MQTAEKTFGSGATAVQPPSTVAAVRPASAVQKYRNEQVMNLTPVEVIRKLYDLAIFGCRKNDRSLAQKAVTELIAALNFDDNDIALNLFQLYDYCKRCIRSGNVDEATHILEELRSAWIQAFQLPGGG